MRKKFLAAVFLVMSMFQNVASAADFNGVDWKNAPTFSTKAEFVRYVQDCEKNCTESIAVVFKGDLFVKTEELLKIYKNAQYANITWWNDRNGKPAQVLYELKVYPGAKIEYAYRTGKTSILTPEEKKLYNLALKIVRDAAKRPTPLLKELYIHEKITEYAAYYTRNTSEKAPRHCTAIGALLDGKANCQGYADAFYMLGRMAGLNVGKMSGHSSDGAHVWNTIEFGDGRIYAVDVTFDDASYQFADNSEYNSYVYFNAPQEIMLTTHTWEAAYNPKLVQKVDGRYFYHTKEFWDTGGKYFGFYVNRAEDALNFIARRISEGRELSYGMAPYDARYGNLEFALNRLVREILPQKYDWYGSVKMSVTHRGNYLFYIADAKKN